ncbi:methyl-CpG-binding domain protein 1-like isoform X2 [Arapaima gigas]
MNKGLLNCSVAESSPVKWSSGKGGDMDEHGAKKVTAAITDEVKHVSNQGAGSIEHGSQSRLESLQQEIQSPSVEMATHSQKVICNITSTDEFGDGPVGSREGDMAPVDEPPEDWLEPLEEDDDEEEDDDHQSWELDFLPGEMHLNGRQDAELESLAGESERSGSLAGSERNFKRKTSSNGVSAPRRRRRQNFIDEEWEEWPILGEGWKRKEVFRRSGFSVGKTDTYYMSPTGDRFRSKIELTRHLSGIMDLSTFDFKSGKFLDAVTYRKMRRRWQKKRDKSPILKEQNTLSEAMGPVDSSYIPDVLPSHLHSAGFQRLQPVSSCSSGSLQRSITSLHFLCPFSTPPRSVPTSPLQVDVTAQWHGNTASPGPGKVTSLSCSTADTLNGEPSFHHLGPPEPGPSLGTGSPAASTPERPDDTHNQCQDRSWGVSGSTQQKLTVQHSLRTEPLPLDTSVTVNGESGPRNSTPDTMILNCTKCGSPYPYADLNRMDQASLCPKCRSEKKPDNRNIIFRKWLPCGQCRACLVTEDCGMCASCRNGLLNPDSRKPVRCRRRKCLCPIRKKKAKDDLEMDNPLIQPYSVLQHSDSEDFSLFLDDDDDVEGGPKKRSRRSCGMCSACLHTTDCGSCDFCIDKPKFGGSNKKRQKCRLRQCQRQAMLGKSEYLTPEGWVGLGRPRPYYQYGARRGRSQKPGASWDDVEFTDDENEESYMGTFKPGFYGSVAEEDRGGFAEHSQGFLKISSGWQETLKENGFAAKVAEATQPSLSLLEAVWRCDRVSQMTEKDGEGDSGKEGKGLDLEENMQIVEVDTEEGQVQVVTPMITQIFSLADTAHIGTELPLNCELLQLLEDLRKAVLPVHWVGLMVEGPRLQLVQCSKLSTMADTVVQIEPGFRYQVSVQDHPLILTHPLYEAHPGELASVAHVISLLLDLERYTVCQGYPVTVSQAGLEPTPYVRAATCDFLVLQINERCAKCSVAPLRL